MDEKLKPVEIGSPVFVEEDGEQECGVVRSVAPGGRDEIVVVIENAGNFIVPAEAVRKAQEDKVMLDPSRLDQRLRDAIARAHKHRGPAR